MQNLDAEAEELRRQAAARKDQAMLGDSGYDRIPADFYPTPSENVDALCTKMQFHQKIWEPACGKGDISDRLIELGYDVHSTDLYNYGYGAWAKNFLEATEMPKGCRSIVTNPPYVDGLAEAFVRHALKLTQECRGQVAMFLRHEFDASKGRMDLFGSPPFHKKIVVTKRPRWIEGSTGSPRHNYSWYVFDWRHKAGLAGVDYIHPDFSDPIRFTKLG